MPNRLADETSPYLQQHADNPVDWYPWGDEAFARARANDKPILLSVGYSACHWCHVMEHESFADRATAELMNEGFVNVKVDREERPDVDAVYMQAVQQMTGHGGWPMTVFLTPDGAPFYGGTYFPPEPRHGMPSFRNVLSGVLEAYRDRRAAVDRSAGELRNALAQGMSVNPAPAALDDPMLDRAFHRIAARFDERLGGFGGAPKFPQPMIIEFLLRHWLRTGGEEALRMVERTLEAMAAGGMYDQIGGGFHRYSVDAKWLVPHFEKMLYDNALLAGVYLRAFQVTGRSDFRRVTEEVLDYVLREMRSPEGGFFSTQDADSEGVEGKFYVWSADEIEEALGEDAGLFRELFGVSEVGNWEGTNILHRPRSRDEVAEEEGIDLAEAEALERRARARLYELRARRIWPGRDEKVIASWNAMMLGSLAEAGRALGRRDFVAAANACADFLLDGMTVDGRLRRTWRDGVPKIPAFLEDHGLLVEGLLALHAATMDLGRVRQARDVADRMLDLFWMEDEGMFYDAPSAGGHLPVRPRDIYDNATPAGTSAAAHALIRLARLTGDARYARVAEEVLGRLAKVAAELPQGFGHLLCALSFQLSPPTEVAVIGPRGRADTQALLDAANARYLPHTAIALADPEAVEDAAALVPFLADRPMRHGHATAYVCRHYTCKEPVTEPAALQLDLDTFVTRPAAEG